MAICSRSRDGVDSRFAMRSRSFHSCGTIASHDPNAPRAGFQISGVESPKKVHKVGRPAHACANRARVALDRSVWLERLPKDTDSEALRWRARVGGGLRRRASKSSCDVGDQAEVADEALEELVASVTTSRAEDGRRVDRGHDPGGQIGINQPPGSFTDADGWA